MIQRIQTVYLALMVICLGLAFVFPFATFPLGSEGEFITLNAFGVSENPQKIATWFPYSITLGLSMGIGIMTIAQFKNRKKQLMFGKVNYILILITLVFIFIDTDKVAEQLGIAENAISYGVGMFTPVAALAFQFLANRGIKADEALVRSMDRLR